MPESSEERTLIIIRLNQLLRMVVDTSSDKTIKEAFGEGLDLKKLSKKDLFALYLILEYLISNPARTMLKLTRNRVTSRINDVFDLVNGVRAQIFHVVDNTTKDLITDMVKNDSSVVVIDHNSDEQTKVNK